MARNSRKRKAEQVSLFGASDFLDGRPTFRKWREIEIKDLPESEKGLEDLHDLLLNLVQRNRQFLKALSMAGVLEGLPMVAEFREADMAMLGNLALMKLGMVKPLEVPAVVDMARQESERLAGLRAKILTSIESERSRRVLESEPRIRIKKFLLKQEISGLAFAIAEEEGTLVEIEISQEGPEEGPGFILPFMVDALVARFELDKRKHAESRPLPRSTSLRALLKSLPAPWLDALVLVLGLEKRGRRAQREVEAARRLQDPGILGKIVEKGLTDNERACLSLVLGRGGEEKASVVTRRFGTDEEDGWFWEERPPTSVLGRLRQHGLAYVGARRKGVRRYRTVAIPDELRDPLGRLLPVG